MKRLNIAGKFSALLFGYAIFCGSLSAGEALWIYTQGPDTRPKGTLEFKIDQVSRLGKDSQDYTFLDLRPEVEYGITDRLTVSLEALIFHHDYAVDSEDLNPMFDTQGGEGGSFRKTQTAGFEVGLKYNLLSAYKDLVGLSLGFSYEFRDAYRLDGADIEQHSFVPAIYLQKNFLDDTLSFAFKGKVEFELRHSPGVKEEEIAPDLAFGTAYRIAPQWFLGLETRMQTDYLEPEVEGEPVPENPSEFTSPGNFRVGTRYQYGYYLGPTLHFAQREWWVTLGLLWQVKGGGAASNPSVRDGKVWDEHERLHLGLSVGFEF